MRGNLFPFKMQQQQSKSRRTENYDQCIQTKKKLIALNLFKSDQKMMCKRSRKRDREREREKSEESCRFGSCKTFTISNMYNVHFTRVFRIDSVATKRSGMENFS